MQVDPITTEVVSKFLQSVVDEMGSIIVRTAFSTNIKEREDCSTAILNERGEIVSLAERIPMHLGSLLGIGNYVLDRIDLTELQEGDVFIGNDAFRGGGTHLNDIVLMQPIFVDGKYCGWVTNLAHHSDFVDRSHKHIFQEGLRIPPIRLYRQGALQNDVLELILLNCQVPRERKNDLAAQMAANRLAVQRYGSLCERYSLDVVKNVEQQIMAYAERKTRASLSLIPNGVYRYDSKFDTNLIDHVLDLSVAVEVKDGSIHFDLSNNPPQVAAPINMVLTATLATLYYAVKTLIDADVPPNAGFHRAITVHAEPGSILNAQEPAAVYSRTDIAMRLVDMILAALQPAIPEKVMAACTGGGLVTISGTNPRSGRFYVYNEMIGGGMGARYARDGMDGTQVHITNTGNLPVEALELEFPLRVERYELVRDSGGPGRSRGGMSIRRTVRALEHDAVVNAGGTNSVLPPFGIAGGADGQVCRVELSGDASPLVKRSGKLKASETVTMITSSGGGYGPSAERSRPKVEKDLREDRISRDAAVRHYAYAAGS
ncbi:hydantoinase B/oxoprolinase family protein [Ensifer sp. ENS02]|uniref:hydantoinase B/oxoprolinase family protein n=1 Tax=Ensifer sp. ENS02 TaxID=2769290 RepID=UPI00177E5FB1|nr:hydantoinase B/oxoprolinase family protein [Ensifer sp. ENS02]MBD9524481.1 hydantoinase B/oxoprolinase family protein [Ensifer sp. ENS02]